MSETNHKHISRRTFFFMSGAATLAGCATTARKSARRISPNERLNVAGVGCGGQAFGDLKDIIRDQENCVALCDPDWERGANGFSNWSKAAKYHDYRKMLDKEHKNIDAVVVACPDHMHAPAALAAMQLGKHVYVEKPLTRTIYEADVLLKAARRYNVATQMGNQGHSGDGVRRMCEAVWAGLAGDITEVHIWTDRPIWPQGIAEPLPEEPVPDTMDWDAWLGVAPMRPFNKGYAPFNWRGWWDFGCGALGDMACHIMDPAYWALDLSTPTSVECLKQENANTQTAPTKALVKYEFPQRVNQYASEYLGKNVTMPPVVVYWYEGGWQPERPENVPAGEQMGDGDNGSLFIGTKGLLTTGCYGDDTRLMPASVMETQQEAFDKLEKIIPRVETPGGHRRDWVRACKDGNPSASDFEYAVPLTKTVLLGNLAMQTGEKVYWDASNDRITNSVRGAKALIKPKYRKSYSLR